MNACHPYEQSETDTVSDLICISENMVPLLTGLWSTLQTWIYPNYPIEYYIQVKDFGAIGLFKAVCSLDPTVCDSVEIPPHPERFLSAEDGNIENGGDRDGLTVYEEFRGFMQTEEEYYWEHNHFRTNPGRAQFFIDDLTGSGDWSTIASGTCYDILWVHDLPDTLIGQRHFIDFKSGNSTGLNFLCDPGYDPPDNLQVVDQAIDVIVLNDNLPLHVLGQTLQYLVNGDLFRGPAGTVAPIEINPAAQNYRIQRLQGQPHFLPTGAPSERVHDLLLQRTYLHEIGHSLGIPEHVVPEEGDLGCVMRYLVRGTSDFPMNPDDWVSYTCGLEYLDDIPNQCATIKGLRP